MQDVQPLKNMLKGHHSRRSADLTTARKADKDMTKEDIMLRRYLKVCVGLYIMCVLCVSVCALCASVLGYPRS